MTSSKQEKISIASYDYALDENRIAQNPVADRETSKLLVYKNGEISHDTFARLGEHMPPKSNFIVNNTRVIPARMFFTRQSGAVIQVFLLNPIEPYTSMELSLGNQSGVAVWQCMVGNARKWKEGEKLSASSLINSKPVYLTLTLIRRNPFLVKFEWIRTIVFSEVLESIGQIPLPPYIKREVVPEDSTSYQTTYAKSKGAVAAPTAGLHFTEELIDSLVNSGHIKSELTLHVGAGTFKPLETDRVWDHLMHEEAFEVNKDLLEKLLRSKSRIAVGTTTLRTLESLYWCGLNLFREAPDPFIIGQFEGYQGSHELTYDDAIELLLKWMQRHATPFIAGLTSIMIMPGYTIRSADALITNFHLPKSTLLLLISAFVGDDWRRIYQEAMKEGYRFLSYGDSSLLYKLKVKSEK